MDNEDPYKVPESNLETLEETNRQFYVVSVKKFTILFFITLGLYGIYWFYKNWKEYKTSTGESIWPVPRAIFSIFFTHALFAKVQQTLDEKEASYPWKASSQATLYVVLGVIAAVSAQLSNYGIASPLSDIVSTFIFIAIYKPLVTAQAAINLSQGDPEGESNSKFTGANYIWSILGVLLWLINFLGLLIIFGFIEI